MAAMAEGKNQQRTKYSLDGNVPKSFPNFLRPFDALCDPEGARIVNAATGEAIVEGVVGPSPSTLFSAIGSLFVWVIFVVLAHMIFTAYQTDPAPNQRADAGHPQRLRGAVPRLRVDFITHRLGHLHRQSN